MKVLNLIFGLIFFSFNAISQEDSNILVRMDRTLFLSNEKIDIHLERKQIQSPSILWIDLISSENKWVTGIKIKLTSHIEHTQLTLPNDILNGYYLLRVYRNFNGKSATILQRKLLKIVNPNLKKIATYKPLSFQSSKNLTKKDTIIWQNLDEFKQQNKVQLASKNFDIIPWSFLQEYPFHLLEDLNVDTLRNIHQLYFRGKILNKFNHKPYQTDAHIAIPAMHQLYFFNTDSLGDFQIDLSDISTQSSIYFNLNDTLKSDSIQLLLGSEFLAAEDFLCPEFTLSNQQKQDILYHLHRTEIQNAFSKPYLVEEKNIAFYGSPDEIIVPDDYVSLNQLYDIFVEIPGYVDIQKSNKTYKLHVFGENPELKYVVPLLMIDFIPVQNLSLFLKIPTKQIQQLEIISEAYIKNNKLFGGIINVITKEKNYAHYPFPTAAQFVDFTFISEPKHVISNNTSIQSLKEFNTQKLKKFQIIIRSNAEKGSLEEKRFFIQQP